MQDSLYIIGHRRPDTDSICSAIAYAYLKNQVQQKQAVACRCGPLNRETAFVLDYFQCEEPVLIKDVRPRTKDILTGNPVFVFPHVNLEDAGRLMHREKIKTLAVVRENTHKLLGLFTVGDLARLLLEAWDTDKKIPMDITMERIMTSTNIEYFDEDDLIEEAKQTMLDTRYRNYPVVDENKKFLGMISRYNLLAVKGKQLILVDHNERSQSVEGVEQAEILEIIDHHRLADMQTPEPIMMRNEPVGSTATIISKMYGEHKIAPPPRVAGLLCSAILSDTLIFKSPTTTLEDIKHGHENAATSGIDIQEFGRAMFKAGSTIHGRTAEDLIFEDFKKFHLGNYIVGIGQIEVVDLDLIREKQSELLDAMNKVQVDKGYDLVILMLTDLLKDGTELLFVGKQSRAIEKAFNVNSKQKSVFLPGVMSRKKQIVPPLSRVLQ